MKKTNILFALISLALLTHCTVLPGYFGRVPPEVPIDTTPVDVPVPSSRKLGQSLSLTLDEAIEIARRNNPTLISGRWDVKTACAQRDIVLADGWPQFTSTGTIQRNLPDQRLQQARMNAEPGLFASGVASLDVSLQMALFTGGRIRSDISAAEFQILAAQSRLGRTWEELIFNITSAFYNILAQRKLLDSLRLSRDLMLKQRQSVLEILSVDEAAWSDLLRTDVRIADIEQRLLTEQNTLDVQLRALTTLIGLNLNAGHVNIEGELRVHGSIPDLKGALAMAFAERGDYRAQRASLYAQAMKINSARASRWPKLSLVGSIGMRAATGIGDSGVVYTDRTNFFTQKEQRGGPLWPYPEHVQPQGSIAVVAEYPLFTGGRIPAQIEEQHAKLASLKAALRQLELQIRLDVETALLNVSSARKKTEVLRKSIGQSKESFSRVQQKYGVRKSSITDVLNVQNAMLNAETNYYKAVAEYNIAVAQLGLATGEKR